MCCYLRQMDLITIRIGERILYFQVVSWSRKESCCKVTESLRSGRFNIMHAPLCGLLLLAISGTACEFTHIKLCRHMSDHLVITPAEILRGWDTFMESRSRENVFLVPEKACRHFECIAGPSWTISDAWEPKVGLPTLMSLMPSRFEAPAGLPFFPLDVRPGQQKFGNKFQQRSSFLNDSIAHPLGDVYRIVAS